MNLKKNISTISYFDVNQKNGGAIFAKNMDGFLNRTGEFASFVYCNKRSQISEQYKENESAKVSNGNLGQRMKDSLRRSQTFELLIHFLRNDLNAILLSFRLFFNNKIKKDTIFLFHDHLSLFYFSFFFSIRKRKVVMIMHNNGSPAEMISSGIKNRTKRKVVDVISNFQMNSIVSKVDKIVFLCDNARYRFMELYDVKKEQTTTIPNGIKPFKLDHSKKNNKDEIRFITVCTMNERKGIDLFIKCLPVLNEKFTSKISFTLIGQGPLLEELKHLSTLYANLNVVGESSEVSDFLDRSDVFFLLSRNEGQPLSILEALRASLFVIATDVGCNSSMINNKNGLLIDVREQSIIDAFSRVIIEWGSYKGKGENSLKLFNESFTEEKMYDSYLQIFNSL
jgi:glycosyltransferase involved in cell wall biosynthesis